MFKCNKKVYDFVVGLGYNCSTSRYLRGLGYQNASYPFDWVTGTDLKVKLDLILNDFKDFINKDDLTIGEENGELHKNEVYVNKKTGMVHPHDFPIGLDLSDSYDSVKSKYDRRVDRLYLDINSHKSVAFIVILTADEECSMDLLSDYSSKLKNKFKKNIDIIIFKDSDIVGDKIDESKGIYVYTGPYVRYHEIMGDANLLSKDILNKVKYDKLNKIKLKRLKSSLLYKVTSLFYITNGKKRRVLRDRVSPHYKYVKYLNSVKKKIKGGIDCKI
jgi:hypothetical protein